MNGPVSLSSCTEVGDEGWTPVRRKRVKKEIPLLLVHCKAPPHVKSTLPSTSDSSDSESSYFRQ